MILQQISNTRVVQIDPVRDLTRDFGEALLPWGGDSGAEPGYARAQRSLLLLNGAIERLGERDRAGIRAQLTERRDTLAAALAAVKSVVGNVQIFNGLRTAGDILQRGRKLTGAAFTDAASKLVAAFEAKQRADYSLHMATSATSRAARDLVDGADADLRQVGRDVAALKVAIQFPELPRADDFAQAEASTADLVQAGKLRGAPKQALATHLACEQGATASDAVARLFMVYEPASGGALFDLRYARFQARKGE